jgi:dethiobiotin synthetase/adenosylmethionine--8-amino-7-oxononanoate aminotransferase
MQHSLVEEAKVNVIDGRDGEDFLVWSRNVGVNRVYDGSASWWTQGVASSMQSELAAAVGYAAGRYGHVMFPENIHEPALGLAEALLSGPGRGWASRVFYSDNGSTALEVALRMAFRKFMTDHKVAPDERMVTIGLNGGYHGDTLGVLNAQAPSPYASTYQHPWYSGAGVFIEPPTLSCIRSRWRVILPNDFLDCTSASTISLEEQIIFSSRNAAFDCNRRDPDPLTALYKSYIAKTVKDQESKFNVRAATLLIEPVLLGAGGMILVDPQFQRVLVGSLSR